MRELRTEQGGFTLLELVVVIVVIIILVTLVFLLNGLAQQQPA